MPESKVKLQISVDSLLRLPEGAAYRKSKDRAHVEATQKGGVIYITGTCDSLQQAVEYYEAMYHTARDALESYREHTAKAIADRRPVWKIYATGLAVGWLAGIAMTIYMTTKTRKKDE